MRDSGLAIVTIVLLGLAATIFAVRWWPTLGAWALLWAPLGVIAAIAVAFAVAFALGAVLAWAEEKWW